MSRKLATPELFLSIVLPALLLAGCSAPPEDLSFRYQLEAPPMTLDPIHASDVYSLGVIDRLFDGLMRLDRARNQPVPELAESVSISEDGLVYEFRLLPEARFHNGRRILASDVVKSWERLLSPANDTSALEIFELVEGAEAFVAGGADSVTGFEAEDPGLVRIRLRRPFVPLLYHLTDPRTGVVPAAEVERLGDRFARHPVGSGPFRFRSWEGDRLVLEAFEGHARVPPAVKTLIFEVIRDRDEALSRYQRRELDLVTLIPAGSLPVLRQTYSSDLRLLPTANWLGICFRGDRPPFGDPRLRRALSFAIDREALVAELGEPRHIPSTGFLPQGIPGHDPRTLGSGYDPERAAALLAEAGYPRGQGLGPLALSSWPTDVAILDIVRRAVAPLGVEIRPQTMEFGQIVAGVEDGSLTMHLFFWAAEFPDPDPYLRPVFHSRGAGNHMAYSNPEVDRLLDLARSELDPERRRDLYGQAEKLIIHDAPCINLCQRTEAVLLRPGWKDMVLGHDANFFEIEHLRLVR